MGKCLRDAQAPAGGSPTSWVTLGAAGAVTVPAGASRPAKSVKPKVVVPGVLRWGGHPEEPGRSSPQASQYLAHAVPSGPMAALM